MQPFEEMCKGRLSPLALKVLADSQGVVWMYGEFVMLLKRAGACFVWETYCSVYALPRHTF